MHAPHAKLLWVTLIQGALTQGELQQSYEQLLEMRHECPSAWPALSTVFFEHMSASLLHSSSSTTTTATAGVTAATTTAGATAAGATAAGTAAAGTAAAAAAAGGTDSNAVTIAGADSGVQQTSVDTAVVDGTSSNEVALAADSTSEPTAMDIDNNSTAAVQLQQQQQQQLSNSSSSGSGSSTAALADTAEAADAAVAAVRVQRLTPAAFHMFVACMDTYNRLQGKIRAPVVPSGADNATDSDTEAAAVAAAGGLRAMAKSYASAIAECECLNIAHSNALHPVHAAQLSIVAESASSLCTTRLSHLKALSLRLSYRCQLC
eukprot:15845-Heterococcus_DN1.PRE.2